jgi:hypothetical protein
MNETTEIIKTTSDFMPQTVDEVRAVEEVRAAITIAKKFPRNEIQAVTSIQKSCKRLGLAKMALYSYPRGGQQVTGPSINLAKMLARNWGNIQCGIREIEQGDDYTIVEAYAWDMETNYRPSRVFKVKHERSTRQGTKVLTDQRDIYELNANMGARRLRACILDLIPTDIIDEAIKMCEDTLAKGDNIPLSERIVKMLQAFEELGVTREMIEAYIQHKIDAINQQEIVNLQKIFVSIKDGYAPREKYFQVQDSSLNQINSVIKAKDS